MCTLRPNLPASHSHDVRAMPPIEVTMRYHNSRKTSTFVCVDASPPRVPAMTAPRRAEFLRTDQFRRGTIRVPRSRPSSCANSRRMCGRIDVWDNRLEGFRLLHSLPYACPSSVIPSASILWTLWERTQQIVRRYHIFGGTSRACKWTHLAQVFDHKCCALGLIVGSIFRECPHKHSC